MSRRSGPFSIRPDVSVSAGSVPRMMRSVLLGVGEKESLHVALDRHRDVVLWKVSGVSDEDLRRPLTPSGTNPLGLVKHLAWCEWGWFCETFDRPFEPFPYPDDPDADLRVEPNETTEDILRRYAKARADADAVIASLDVEDTGVSAHDTTVTLRWVLIHMIEETARHTGHLDILRELIDGQTGDHPDR